MDDGSSMALRRSAACAALLRDVRSIASGEGISASSLGKIKSLLATLAAQVELFPETDFAMPEAQGCAHSLDPAANDGLGLYYTIGLPGKEAAPHDHGIWCVGAAISGRELQCFYRRTDDGGRPGFATIEQIDETVLEPGAPFAMADHDIHSTLAIGDRPIRSLALYGYALNRFPAVVYFHPQFKTCRTLPSKRALAGA
jgi:predicted metal-dependent enzyme (double-stranded beta helix superfamily)